MRSGLLQQLRGTLPLLDGSVLATALVLDFHLLSFYLIDLITASPNHLSPNQYSLFGPARVRIVTQLTSCAVGPFAPLARETTTPPPVESSLLYLLDHPSATASPEAG